MPAGSEVKNPLLQVVRAVSARFFEPCLFFSARQL